MSDWQPPPNPPGPPPGPGQPPGGGYVSPGPPPGQSFGPPPGAAPPPPPPGQAYGYPQSGGYPPAGYPPGGAYGGPPFAGFGSRFGAFLIDILITSVIPVIAFIALAAGPKGDRHLCTVNDELHTCQNPTGATWAIFGILMVAGVIFGIYYNVFLLGRTGQTLGNKAVGISVVDKRNGQPIGPGRAFIRLLVRAIASGLLCGLGYWWMLWDEEKQTWQDKVANSYVITV